MFLGRIMNSNEASSFFPSCGSYDPHHQPWGWRQESCYPYYSETMPPINHHLPSLPPDVGRNSCAAANSDCRLNESQIGYVDSNGAIGNHLREESHQDHSNDRWNRKGNDAGMRRRKEKKRMPKEEMDEIQERTGMKPEEFRDATSERKHWRRFIMTVARVLRTDRYVEKTEIPVESQASTKQQDAASGSSDCSGNKKKRDRFNGMTEEDVLKRTVPDLVAPNLDIIIIGSCPGLTAAYLGHHYAGPGNHFWKCLYLSGLIPEPMNANDDYKLKQYGIGFTNFVARCTKGSVEFSRREIKEGVESLTEKIQTYKPKIAVFNGKGIYEVFCNHKNFYIGKQPEPFPGTNTVVYVMPSSSARCSQLPRASDKVPFFIALRKLRDHLHGCLPHLDESEVVFPDLDLKVEPRKDRRPVEENHATQESTGAAHSSSADKDRKRKHVDCNFNAVSMAVHDRPSYHHGLHPSFAAMSQDIAPEFKWNSGFQKWPTALGIPHSSPLVGMSPRTDCNYDALLAKQEDAAGQVLNPCSLLRGLPSAPFYAGWSDSQHRWTMNGLATRFSNDTRYPVNIPTYLQYPDMISCADRLSSHLSAEPTYRPMYPNLSAYPQDAFLPSSGTATSSAFSYNTSLSRDIKPGTSQFDPVFFQRPSYSPPSYYHQYR